MKSSFAALQQDLFIKPRLSVVLQNENTECALACLVMLSSYHGYKTTIDELRQKFGPQANGTSLAQLIEYAQQLDLAARPLQLSLSELKELNTPCILHWDLNHFVVLKSVAKHFIVIHDPALGQVKVSMQEVDKRFSGIALELLPTKTFSHKKPPKKLSIWHFVEKTSGFKRQLIGIGLLSLCLQLLALLSPFYIQTVVDQVVVQNAQDLLLSLAIGFTLLLLLEVVFSWFREFLILRSTTSLSLMLSMTVFRHLMQLTTEFFQRRHLGDISTRFNSLVPIREFLVSGVVSGILDGFMALATLAVLYVYSSLLANVVLIASCFYLLIRWICLRQIKQIQTETLVADAKQQSHFLQSLRAIKTLKLSGNIPRVESEWLNKLCDLTQHNVKLSKWQIAFASVNKLIFGLENIVIVFLAAGLVMSNAFSLGMLFAFISYKTRFTGAVNQFIQQWINYLMLSVHLGRLEDILYSPKEQQTSPFQLSQTALPSGVNTQNTYQVSIQKLAFHYPLQPPVFQNLNLNIYDGEIVAVLGKSGSGKTTFLNCLSGLTQPSSGQIHIQQRLLTAGTRSHLNIACVMQDDSLLSGSILQNITGFNVSTDIKRVVMSCIHACIYQDIMNQPMQFHSLIGDMGSSLSGGQKQRLMIARALYSHPKLLLLDEATSHLDIPTEKRLMKNLRQLGITVIMIAHRPHTIQSADRIVQLTSNGFIERQHPKLLTSTKAKE
ncbi:peptidase domain-containing ABC transporter [Glaciecola sp. 1036]|uniref:peptidase domain-containing ABC transporter n=1 Tax=Alteromonadaceae TaxID=72275 RepID=UPI003D07C0AD